jgi:mannose-1-phosphate guanylyltransferase/mannose-6-phosphate isomerase
VFVQLRIARRLVTFGIVPSHPTASATWAARPQDAAGFAVERFVEKPDAGTAAGYLAEGGYYWNSGMFLFKASALLDELARLAPEMVSACEAAMAGARLDLDFCRVDKAAFERCPSDSIDYAVMEKTDRAVVVPMDAGWTMSAPGPRCGRWSSATPPGTPGAATCCVKDCRDSYVHAGHRLVALLGLENVVVVETPDAVMVAHKGRAQDVKRLVDRLKAEGRPEATLHRQVFRPWGSSARSTRAIASRSSASRSSRARSCRCRCTITAPNTGSWSLGHRARALGRDRAAWWPKNESIYLPLGTVHCLENPGKLPLELIEVQTGSYLGEDDVVRFEDRYGRA